MADKVAINVARPYTLIDENYAHHRINKGPQMVDAWVAEHSYTQHHLVPAEAPVLGSPEYAQAARRAANEAQTVANDAQAEAERLADEADAAEAALIAPEAAEQASEEDDSDDGDETDNRTPEQKAADAEAEAAAVVAAEAAAQSAKDAKAKAAADKKAAKSTGK